MLYRCSQTCLVGCNFFNLLKFVLLKDQRAEENRKRVLRTMAQLEDKENLL